jgi:hypothetical protein
MNMVQLLNAHERSESDWRDIVSATDSRLELTRILVSKTPGRIPYSRQLDSQDALVGHGVLRSYMICLTRKIQIVIRDDTDFQPTQTPHGSTDSIIEISLRQE